MVAVYSCLLTLLTASSLVSASYTPLVPATAAYYHVANYSSIKLLNDDKYSLIMCFEMTFKNILKFPATQWSAYVAVEKISRWQGFGDVNVDTAGSSPWKGFLIARVTPRSNGSPVPAGGTFTLTACADKTAVKVPFAVSTLKSEVVFSIGMTPMPAALDLKPSDLLDSQQTFCVPSSTESSVLSGALAGAVPSALAGISTAPSRKIQLFFPTDSNVAVFKIVGDVISSGTVSFANLNSFASMAYIVFNIDGNKVSLSNVNGDLFKGMESKVVFNCPAASEVSVTGGSIPGSIIAPLAEVKVAGKVLGKVHSSAISIMLGGSVGNITWAGFAEAGLCAQCAKGFFGETCKACTCGSNFLCDDGVAGTGACSCKPNFDETCTECAEGFFGPECKSQCSSTCLARGTCDDGLTGSGLCQNCVAPWGGAQCDDCASNRYGSSCQFTCSVSCSNRGVCDSGKNGTGGCRCTVTGWGGTQCDVCDRGHYGPSCQFACSQTCAANGICSNGFNGTGECLSCGPNFNGTECEFCKTPFEGLRCDRCPTGKFGRRCEGVCSDTCLENGYCDFGLNGTGKCSCKNGFYGGQCQFSEDSSAHSSFANTVVATILVVILSLIILL